MLSNCKAQGSLEYLLLIGGAILVAVIVIGLIISTSTTVGEEQSEETKAVLWKLRQKAYGRQLVLLEDSFENWEAGKPKGWIAAPTGSLIRFTPEKGTESVDGDNASFYFHDPPNMIWEWSAVYFPLPDAEAFAGDTLKATFWVKGKSDNHASTANQWGFASHDIDSVVREGTSYKTITINLRNEGWGKYEVVASIPSDASGPLKLTFPVRVGCLLPGCIGGNNEPTNVWVDNVKIEVLPPSS